MNDGNNERNNERNDDILKEITQYTYKAITKERHNEWKIETQQDRKKERTK